MFELAGNAHEIGQVEMAHPDDINPVHGCDFVHRRNAVGGFHQGDDERARIRRRHLVGHGAALVIVMRHAEGRAAPARRRIAGRGDDLACLCRGLDHRDHDAHCAHIQAARNEVILQGRNPDHGHKADAAASGDLALERLDGDAGMLHVEQDKFRAGRLGDLRHAGCEELKDHGAENMLAGAQDRT